MDDTDAPLTHHAILALVAPFARRGRRVDLPACDRAAGRIAFRAVDHPASDRLPALRESLSLERQPRGAWRLVRTLEPAGGGPAATLTADGPEPGDLLARVDAVPPATQLDAGPGWSLAMAHRLPPGAARADEAASLILSRGSVRAHGVELTMKVPTVSGISADIVIADAPAGLPDDLLEVLGRAWGRLDRGVGGWTGHVGLGGRGDARYRDAEAKLRRVAAHLGRTLGEPPARYRERLQGVRWGVAVRRAVPLMSVLGIAAAAALVPSLGLARESPIWMLIFNAPPLLLALFFSLREMPRIVLPRPPRGPADDAWTPPSPEPDPCPRTP
ncbi:MAG: hypothetical protein RJA99_106 [Pseudomonadota bacterium]|jgi:hypothetical protein